MEKTDLQLAYKALSSKQSTYNELWSYYDGDQPLMYSTRRLREIFRAIDARFVENWCAVVVDSVLDRIRLQQFTVGDDEEVSVELNKLWKATEMDLDADDAHLAALVTGEAFVIAWPDEERRVQAYYNDPRLCHVQYDSESPRVKKWAAKWWVGDDGHYRLNLYYPDRLEYYRAIRKGQVTSWSSFVQLQEPARNEYGEIPVFHFRRERRTIKSELNHSILTLQDATNKLLADMMVAAEFGAFKQRYIISNADVATLKNAPNEVWDIPAGDGQGQATQVGEFSATELRNYVEGMDRLASAISAISRTPKHFFFAKQGQVPSGEALIAMEAPLNKKCERYVARFGNTWQRVAAFVMKLNGQEVDPEAITPDFATPETVQPRTRAEIQEIRVRSGEPLTYVMRSQGASEADVEKMKADRREEQVAAQQSLAQALLEQQRRFDRGQEEGNGPET